MNPGILLPYDTDNTNNNNGCVDLLISPRLDQAPRLTQRQLSSPVSAMEIYHHPQKPCTDGDDSNVSMDCCSAQVPIPQSPTCVAQLVLEEPLLTHFAARNSAALTLQRMIRGTLARWNLPVLKLQHKLASIQALKEKQLRKLRQRTEQTKRAKKAEHEYLEEHRIVRRRLRRAKILRERYADEKVLLLEENQQLRAQCQQLAMNNDECAKILGTYIQNMELAQRNLSLLKSNRQGLEATCHTYQTIVTVFEQVVAAREDSDPASSSEDSYPVL